MSNINSRDDTTRIKKLTIHKPFAIRGYVSPLNGELQITQDLHHFQQTPLLISTVYLHQKAEKKTSTHGRSQTQERRFKRPSLRQTNLYQTFFPTGRVIHSNPAETQNTMETRQDINSTIVGLPTLEPGEREREGEKLTSGGSFGWPASRIRHQPH